MLKKKYRLGRKRKEFEKAYATKFFTLRTRQNNLLHSRFGFVVTKKIDTRAVVRNRIRRIFSSCIEKTRDSIRVGFDMLFVVKKQAIGMSYHQLFESIKTLLIKEEYIH